MCFPRVDEELPNDFQERLLDLALGIQTLLHDIQDMPSPVDQIDALGQLNVVLQTSREYVRVHRRAIDG